MRAGGGSDRSRTLAYPPQLALGGAGRRGEGAIGQEQRYHARVIIRRVNDKIVSQS